jgi:hypothetical protein
VKDRATRFDSRHDDCHGGAWRDIRRRAAFAWVICAFLHYQVTWGGYEVLRWYLFDVTETTFGTSPGKPLDVLPDYAHDSIRRVLLLPLGQIAEESSNEFIGLLSIIFSSAVWGAVGAGVFLCGAGLVQLVRRKVRGTQQGRFG